MFWEWIRALINKQLNYFLAPTDYIEQMSTHQNGHLHLVS